MKRMRIIVSERMNQRDYLPHHIPGNNVYLISASLEVHHCMCGSIRSVVSGDRDDESKGEGADERCRHHDGVF